jgi:hypothetical protein
MPIEIDPISSLVNPVYALGVALIAILSAFLVAFWLLRQSRRRTLAMRRVALIAEIFVVVGVVGIFTFVGRARVESQSLELSEKVSNAISNYSRQWGRLNLDVCWSRRNPPASANVVTAESEVCRQLNVTSNAFDVNYPWIFAAQDYEKLSKRVDVPANLQASLQSLAEATWQMHEAREAKALHAHVTKSLSISLSWLLVLVCAISVAVGAGLKCARAAADLWPGANHEG